MMEYVASLAEPSKGSGIGLREDRNISHHPHALLFVRTIIMALRLVTTDSCPDVEHLKLPRALASGTTTNKVGLASTMSALA